MWTAVWQIKYSWIKHWEFTRMKERAFTDIWIPAQTSLKDVSGGFVYSVRFERSNRIFLRGNFGKPNCLWCASIFNKNTKLFRLKKDQNIAETEAIDGTH